MARKEKYIKVKKYKGNTYFTVQFQYGDQNHKQTYSKTFNSADYDTPAMALNAACEHRDIKRGELATKGLPTHRMTVNEAYELSKEVFVRSESSNAKYDQYYNKYIKPKYAKYDMKDIDEWIITSHLESLRTTHTQTVLDEVLGIWKKICRTARGKKAITSNPTDAFEAPHSTVFKEKRKQDFTDEEANLVIAELLNEKRAGCGYNKAICASMVKVSRYTGLRPRELKGVHRNDIDFENSVLYIRPSGKNLKNQSAIRTIPLSTEVKGELLKLCTVSRFDYIFSFLDGSIPTPHRIAQTISKAAKRAGVPGFHLYGMRHSFDSELITNGVDPRTVMELMGHKNLNTTIAVYARSNEEKRREAIEKVENGRKMS